jgi:hypothetical protein
MAKATRTPPRETELYQPIRDYLVRHGYTVRAEVEHCDVTATKGETLVIVELKRRMSPDLLIQATDRQRITDGVYVALPGPPELGRRSRWRGVMRLLRRLELGLLTVSFGKGASRVDVVFHPLPYQRQKQRRRQRAVLREMSARSDNRNEGGSSGRRLITAYREQAIHIACALDRFGPLAPRQLRALGTGGKTLSILSNNYYGWFTRIDRGVYALTAGGVASLSDYPDLAAQYRKALATQEYERRAAADDEPRACR